MLDLDDEAPYYSINKLTGSPPTIFGAEEAIGYLPLMNYNTSENQNFSPLSSGSVTINAILNLNKDDLLGIVYNNINDPSKTHNIQGNIIELHGYFNVIRLA